MAPVPLEVSVTVGTEILPIVIVPLEALVVDKLIELPTLPDIVPVVDKLPESPIVSEPLPMPVELTAVAPLSVTFKLPLVVLAASVVAPVAALVTVAPPLPVVILKALEAVKVVLPV